MAAWLWHIAGLHPAEKSTGVGKKITDVSRIKKTSKARKFGAARDIHQLKKRGIYYNNNYITIKVD